MSQQNENELWDLIQDDPQDPPKAETKKPAAKAASDSKKSPWMFVSCGLGVALIATVAMLITGAGSNNTPSGSVSSNNPGTSDQSALVQELQSQVDSLNEENNALLEQIDDMSADAARQNTQIQELLKLYNEMSENLEYVESNAALNSSENAEKYHRTMEAYATLIKAQNAFLQYDEKTLDKCIDELMDDLELLDQEALMAFYNVMEYMEQPYWKNQD